MGSALYFSFLINTESLVTDQFGDHSINKEAKFITYYSDPSAPSMNNHLVNREVLNDQTSLFQIGDSQETIFYDLTGESIPLPGLGRYYPSKSNPYGPYYYYALFFTMNLDVTVHNRKTYSLLDWLGDVGGLLDGLYLVVEFFIASYQTLILNRYLSSALVWIKPSFNYKNFKS